MTRLPKDPYGFRRREDGALTVVNIFFLMAIALLAGIAIDVASVVSARTQLQATADAAAHAALVEREFESADDSRTVALTIAENNMPKTAFGDVLATTNITFGDYDRDTDTFTADNTSRNAVFLQTERLSSNNNPVGTFLLQFAGLWNWDVRTAALYETFIPTCLMEGFVANNIIDIQSNNSYFNGFCIHSNTYVTINNNNFFESGTVVSMPDKDDLVVSITGSGEDKNEGLEEALREGKWFIKILNRIDLIRTGLQTSGHKYARDYTKFFTVIDVNLDMKTLKQGNKWVIQPSNLQKGRVYKITNCNKVDFKSGTYQEVVFLLDCPVELSNGVILIDTAIHTTFSGAKSFYSPANIVLGKNDDCGEGGGAQLVTKGSVDFSAGLEMYGSQIIAGGNVEFSSNADGLQGASIVAGGRIDSTSNMNFAFCGDGMQHNFLAEYFRLAG